MRQPLRTVPCAGPSAGSISREVPRTAGCAPGAAGCALGAPGCAPGAGGCAPSADGGSSDVTGGGGGVCAASGAAAPIAAMNTGRAQRVMRLAPSLIAVPVTVAAAITVGTLGRASGLVEHQHLDGARLDGRKGPANLG